MTGDAMTGGGRSGDPMTADPVSGDAPDRGRTRVALVTGAARGIGAATVRLLAEQGWGVVAVDACAGPHAEPYPMPERGELAAVTAYGDVVDVVADVRDLSALRAATELALARWGRLDAVVAAAAIVDGGQPLWQMPPADVQRLLEVDVLGVWNCAAATIPAILAGPDPADGRFVALASAAGSHGLFGLGAYTAAKHAVVGLVRGLAADLTGTGVAAIAVSPGSTRTPMLDRTAQLYRVPVEELVAHQRIGRVIEPAEIAAVVVSCCGPQGALFNGSVVHADGGFLG